MFERAFSLCYINMHDSRVHQLYVNQQVFVSFIVVFSLWISLIKLSCIQIVDWSNATHFRTNFKLPYLDDTVHTDCTLCVMFWWITWTCLTANVWRGCLTTELTFVTHVSIGRLDVCIVGWFDFFSFDLIWFVYFLFEFALFHIWALHFLQMGNKKKKPTLRLAYRIIHISRLRPEMFSTFTCEMRCTLHRHFENIYRSLYAKCFRLSAKKKI